MPANVVDLGGGNRIEFDWKAFDAIRRSGAMQGMLESIGNQMAADAGSDYECKVKVMPTRAYAKVSSAGGKGDEKEATEKSLTKAVR